MHKKNFLSYELLKDEKMGQDKVVRKILIAQTLL